MLGQRISIIMARLCLVIVSAVLCLLPVDAAKNLRMQDPPDVNEFRIAVNSNTFGDGPSGGESGSKKYLISSFPSIKTVAYTHLPDTVWRPLYIGTVANPMSVVADPTNARLFVGDPTLQKIFWYRLIIEDNGFLKTDGQQHVAVDGVTPYWMTVNGVGDLYFTGQMVMAAPASSFRAVYRMDGSKIDVGDALNPVKVYGRDDTGFPVPRVWMPSGIAVDSFDIYWGNQEHGIQNGAVCSGTRKNIGVTGVLDINVHSQANNEVRGMAIAGTNIFYVTPNAIYGMDKSTSGEPETDPLKGVIQSSAVPDGWNPVSIAFDGEGTMYWTEARAGIVYQFPAQDTNPHPMHKYSDAPQVYGLTIFSQAGASKGSKPLKKNFGTLVSSAQVADESAAPAAFHLHLLTGLLSIALHFLAC